MSPSRAMQIFHKKYANECYKCNLTAGEDIDSVCGQKNGEGKFLISQENFLSSLKKTIH